MKKPIYMFTAATICAASLLSADNAQANYGLVQQKDTKGASERNMDVLRATCTRPLSNKQKKSLHKVRIAQDKKGKQLKRVGTAPKFFDWCSQGSIYSADAIHTVRERANSGDTVEIENGAVFSIKEYDTGCVSQWQKGQSLRISPAWYSRYQYCIYNQATNTTVEAKLSLGPFLKSPHTRSIIQILPTDNVIILDNNQAYKISYADVFQKWQVNDKVIIGDNSGWWTWGFNHIVINVTSDCYLPARVSVWQNGVFN